LGTGSTLDAAIQLNREGAGCEEDKECCQAISKRLWETTNKLIQSNYFIIYISEQVEYENQENIDTDDEDDGYPTNNHPDYLKELTISNCTNDQILRFESEILCNLKVKESSFLENEKGLYADYDIPKGYYFLTQLDKIIAYYWGEFMTKKQVQKKYDDKKIVAHRLMEINIHPKYKYIDGDIRCAATYINDARGSSKHPNVIFEENENAENILHLVQIKTLREIQSGEELLIEYGNKFHINEKSTSIQKEKEVFITFTIQFNEVENEINNLHINESNITQDIPNLVETTNFNNPIEPISNIVIDTTQISNNQLTYSPSTIQNTSEIQKVLNEQVKLYFIFKERKAERKEKLKLLRTEEEKKKQEALEKILPKCCVCGYTTSDKDTCTVCNKFVHYVCTNKLICTKCNK
jgi:hypothetical protein